MADKSASSLQHPRRSLGNRHRSQAQKFLNLSKTRKENLVQNLNWAEQSGRQALLHDFTHEENWQILAEIKTLRNDEHGLRALLEDLFAVLGRDPEQLNQLVGVDMIEHGHQLVCAALASDPLDPTFWGGDLTREFLDEFETRFFTLDLSDSRASVLFGRRLEKILPIDEERFIRMIRRLLAQRPFNHEAWTQLGKLHEMRKEYDEAWFSYDQAQSHFPQISTRDDFRLRMERRLDNDRSAWKRPDSMQRDEFLIRMENLALRPNEENSEENSEVKSVENVDLMSEEESEESTLLRLIGEKEYSAAFFLARRLVAGGESWATQYLEIAQSKLDSN